MLKTNTLFGIDDKVQNALTVIRSYHRIFSARGISMKVAFSGGKDSVVIKELVKMSGVPFTSFYNYVGIDPPELVQFVKKYHSDSEFIKPPTPFFIQMLKEGMPPLRQQRWCCRVLKEFHGSGLVVIGIRAAESSRRAKRLQFEPCKNDREKFFLSPILEWSDADVWEFIKSKKLPYCKLYDEGRKRIGCLFCPMAPNRKRKEEAIRWPKFKGSFLATFKRLIAKRNAEGKKCTWNTADEMWEWWLNAWGKKNNNEDQQCFKFDD